MLNKLKKITGVMLLAAAGLALIPSGANAAILSYNTGDLLLGFWATGGTGADKSYVINLGAASNFRDGITVGNLSLGNVGTDLDAVFDPGWAARGDLFWGVIAATSSTASTIVNGDPGRTVYAGSTSTTPWDRGGSTAQNGIISAVNGVVSSQGFLTGDTQSTANSDFASLKLTSAGNVWSTQAPGGFGAYSSVFNGTPAETLNLYRMVRATGTDFGPGSLEGYFNITGGGQISFTAAAVPEPSTYALLGLGLGALVMLRRFRASKQANA